MFADRAGQRPSPDAMARAIAAFERTMCRARAASTASWSRTTPAFSRRSERAGFDYFTGRARCTGCHHVFPVTPDGRKAKPPLFTDFLFHNTGVGFGPRGFADRGRHEQTRNPADWGAFRTPPLRSSARTPPYMHDGSLGTLEEVVEFLQRRRAVQSEPVARHAPAQSARSARRRRWWRSCGAMSE